MDFEYLSNALYLEEYLLDRTSTALSAAMSRYDRNPTEENNKKIKELQDAFDRHKQQIDNLRSALIEVNKH